jgi:hypothetical protein
MTTLVVIALDNLTLREEGDDPNLPTYLLTVGTLMNDQMNYDREEYSRIYNNMVCFGQASYMIGLEDDGLIHMRCVSG